MGRYTGTDGSYIIRPSEVSAGVLADPPGSTPSDAGDFIDGLNGNDGLGGGGGGDVINGGGGLNSIFDAAVDEGSTNSGNVIHGNGGSYRIDIAIRDTGGANPAANSAWGDDGDDTVALTYSVEADRTNWAGAGPTGTITLHGGAGNDTVGVYGSLDTFGLDMAATSVFLYGESGNDKLDASSYDPNQDGSPYPGHNPDFLYGGAEDDAYHVLEIKDQVIEKAGEGYDSVDANSTDYTLGPNIEKLEMSYNVLDFPGPTGFHGTGNALGNLIIGSDRDEVLDGAGGNDTIYGSMTGASNGMFDRDTVHGNAGNDTIYGAASAARDDGADQLYGDDGNDRIFALFGDDQVYGGTGNDDLAGQAGNDALIGGEGNDRLGGGTGNDWLNGQAGGDVLTGRAGADVFAGEGGNDRFVYETPADTPAGEAGRDRIIGFDNVGASRGDVIDLSAIDADAGKAGNQAFTFVGTQAPAKAGQLAVADADVATLIRGDVNGTPGADFEILVKYIAADAGDWRAEDFIL